MDQGQRLSPETEPPEYHSHIVLIQSHNVKGTVVRNQQFKGRAQEQVSGVGAGRGRSQGPKGPKSD